MMRSIWRSPTIFSAASSPISAATRSARAVSGLCRKHRALDRLAQDHCRLARRLLRHRRHLAVQRKQFRPCRCRARQPEIQDGAWSVQPDRILPRRRLRHAFERRARRDHDRGPQRSRDKTLAVAAAGAHRGAEVGVRSKIVPGLDTSLSLFILDQDFEILFSGDAGDTSATAPAVATASSGPTIIARDRGSTSTPISR